LKENAKFFGENRQKSVNVAKNSGQNIGPRERFFMYLPPALKRILVDRSINSWLPPTPSSCFL
jgi:hypothetical protein